MPRTDARKKEEKQNSEVYFTKRRKITTSANVRDGPIPIEDSMKANKERPGQLSISELSRDKKHGLAGSIELLEYFLRLSHQDSKEENVDINYLTALLISGADINSTDDYGQTVLHAVARDWHPGVARFLIDNGADVNKADSFGRTPIFTAVLLNFPEMIEFLASRGADIHKRTLGESQTPLHYAVKGNAVNSLKVLLKLGANLNAEDFKGRTPFFVAVEQGNADVTQYLLDKGCPTAIWDNDGYSAMAHMAEKMPNIALEALSQFLSVDAVGEKKAYYLAPLESAPNLARKSEQRTVLQIIIKYNEIDLLQHPVVQRLVKLKWDNYARFHVLIYWFLNLFYCLIWMALAIMSSATKHSIDKRNPSFISLTSLAFVLTISSAIEQSILGRKSQQSEKQWKESRIASLEKDIIYCHPQWPHEKEFIELQKSRYTSMAYTYYKNFWTYLEWTIFLAATSWIALSIIEMNYHNATILQAEKINLTVVVFLVWMRFFKACRAFQVGGEFIAILVQVLAALGKFAFLFFLFFIPFIVSFWIFFGGSKNSDIIAAKYPRFRDAFRLFNDVAYTVWTLTVLVGFPMQALRHIDKTIANVYIALYYLVMSIVTLNLFIAFLSNVFSRVYKEAKKYAMLEHATMVLLTDHFVSKKTKEKVHCFVRDKCNPLIEKLEFREWIEEGHQSPENVLLKIRNKLQIVIGGFQGKGKGNAKYNKLATMKQIDHNIKMVQSTLATMDESLAKIQKFNVEIKKIKRIVAPSTKRTEEHKGVKTKK